MLKVKSIRQADLTSDCWGIQMWGLSACEECDYKGTDLCGGEAIIEKIKQGAFPEGGLPEVHHEA